MPILIKPLLLFMFILLSLPLPTPNPLSKKVIPPKPFIPMGLTVSGIFSDFVGNEGVNFVSYHVRRTYCTVVSHAVLLLGYFGGIAYFFYPQMRAAAIIYGKQCACVVRFLDLQID